MTRIISEAESLVQQPNFHWSLERYHAAIKAGVLTGDDKVELLFGKLIPMSPIGITHAKTVKKINRVFTKRFPEAEYTVGVQDPVTLVDDSEPEPDLHIAKGALEDYDHHPFPVDLLLIVEVADTTLNRDRTIKKINYAAAGIVEYWIINVYEQEVERYTEPDPESGDFAQKEIFKAGQEFTSEKLGVFQVDDLLVKR